MKDGHFETKILPKFKKGLSHKLVGPSVFYLIREPSLEDDFEVHSPFLVKDKRRIIGHEVLGELFAHVQLGLPEHQIDAVPVSLVHHQLDMAHLKMLSYHLPNPL